MPASPRISRRTALKGLGTVVALPWLRQVSARFQSIAAM